jgi:hypothetical protein
MPDMTNKRLKDILLIGAVCFLPGCKDHSSGTTAEPVAINKDTLVTDQAIEPVTGTWLAKAELNGKFGCLDTAGHEVIPVKYDDMGFWGNDLIPVNTGAKEVNYSKEGGKWGYCNSKGVLVIALQFDKAETFHEGLAAVRIKHKWGFIDTAGKIVIAPQYDDARIFHEGLCAIAINDKWGFIDTRGNIVIKPEYGEIHEFDKDVAVAFVGKMARSEEEETKGAYCLINKKGERIIAPIYKMIWNFSEGLAKAEIRDPADEYSTKAGFINTRGEVVVPLIYDRAENFSEGLAAVGIVDRKKVSFSLDEDCKYGYVNVKGEEVIKLQFSQANKFVKGRAVVSKGRQRSMGTIETIDSTIVNYEDWPKYALLDRQGNYILGFDWRWLSAIDNSLFIAERAKYTGSGVITIKGETVIPFKYTNFKYAGAGFFTADDGGGDDRETQLINIHNQVLFRSKKYGMPATKVQLGLLNIRTNGLRKSGFIDTTGKLVIPDKYDMIWGFEPTKG